MNVCVQNTVFLRRIGYSFCFYSELGGHISNIWLGKFLEIPVGVQQDPLTGILVPSFSCPRPHTTSYSLLLQEKQETFNQIFIFSPATYCLLESILNQNLFQKEKQSLG